MSKLFDKWDLDEVKVEDLGLVKYICLDETLVPHTSGRHVKRQFAKSKVSIVERLMNKVMRTHLNSGKKNKAYNIVKEALEIMFTEGHNKLTIGSCCLDEYKKTMGNYPN